MKYYVCAMFNADGTVIEAGECGDDVSKETIAEGKGACIVAILPSQDRMNELIAIIAKRVSEKSGQGMIVASIQKDWSDCLLNKLST